MRADVYLAAGAAALLGAIPLLVIAVGALAERDYVGGALLVFASAAIGHMGLELVALGEQFKSGATNEEDDR